MILTLQKINVWQRANKFQQYNSCLLLYEKKIGTTPVSHMEHKHEIVTIISQQRNFWFWKAETFVQSELWNPCKLVQMCKFRKVKCSKNCRYLSTKIPKAKEYKTPGLGLFLLTTKNLWAVFRDNICFYNTSCKYAVGHLFLLKLRQTISVSASCSSPPLHRSFPGHTPFAQIYSSYTPCPFACNCGVATF